MFFANFNELKIEKEFHYSTKHFDIEVFNYMPLTDLKAKIDAALHSQVLEHTDTPVLYHFNITGLFSPEDSELQQLLDDMLVLTNVIVPITLQSLETGKGYKRERRLNAPDKLKPLHTTYSVIKRACNHEIITPVLNIQISYSGVSYLLCDTKEIDKYEKSEEDSSDE